MYEFQISRLLSWIPAFAGMTYITNNQGFERGLAPSREGAQREGRARLLSHTLRSHRKCDTQGSLREKCVFRLLPLAAGGVTPHS